MEIDYVDKSSILMPTIYSAKKLVEKKEIKLCLDSTNNLYSINHNLNEIKKFKSIFKSFFSFSPPNISYFEKNEKALVFWVRTYSYFVLGKIDKKIISEKFENISSITDQTGGWICFNLSGKNIKLLLEKLMTTDLFIFESNQVLRTSINKINCFVLCHKRFENYTIICPTSFMESMKGRLLNLINLVA